MLKKKNPPCKPLCNVFTNLSKNISNLKIIKSMRFNIKIIKISHYNVYSDVVKNSHTTKYNHITHNVKCLLHHTHNLLTVHTESKVFHITNSSVSFPHHTECLLMNHTASKVFHTTHSSVSFPHHT